MMRPADKNHREFQPLALMNGHDANHVRTLVQDVGLSEIHLIFFELLNVAHKMGGSAKRSLFKGPRLC